MSPRVLVDTDVCMGSVRPADPHHALGHPSTAQSASSTQTTPLEQHTHPKRTVMGREVVAAVTGGTLDFGPWEEICCREFDGRRRKRVLVKSIGAEILGR